MKLKKLKRKVKVKMNGFTDRIRGRNRYLEIDIDKIDEKIIANYSLLIDLLIKYPIAHWHMRLAQIGAGITTGSTGLATFFYIKEGIEVFPAYPLISFGVSIFILGIVFWAFDERKVEEQFWNIFRSLIHYRPSSKKRIKKK